MKICYWKLDNSDLLKKFYKVSIMKKIRFLHNKKFSHYFNIYNYSIYLSK